MKVKKRAVKLIVLFLCITAAGAAVAWFLLPVVNARYYWEKAVLHTSKELLAVSAGRIDRADPYSQYVKLIVDKADVDGRSTLILPGGFGMTYTKKHDSVRETAEGSLDAYFMGSMRQGLTYRSNRQDVEVSFPDFMDGTKRMTQDTLYRTLGIRLVSEPEEVSDIAEAIKGIFLNHPMEYISRDDKLVVIGIQVPADEIDGLLSMFSDKIKAIPGRFPANWTAWLEDYQPEEHTVTVRCSINWEMKLTEIQVPGLLDLSLDKITQDGLVEGHALITLGTDEARVDAKLLGSWEADHFTYQIPNIAVNYTEPGHSYYVQMSGMYMESQLDGGVRGPEVSGGEYLDLESAEVLKQKFMNDIAELGFSS